MCARDFDFDTIEKAELEQIQLERLQATINRAYRSVSYYRQRFDELGIVLQGIDSLEGLQQLPFTNHETLLASYPYGMFAVPLREVVRLHCSSAPTGEPLVIGYTKNDVEHWTRASARVLQAAGAHPEDVVQICLDYGLYGAGLGFHYGAERIGASAIPASDVDALRQLLIMRDYRSTILLSTPSFALKLVATLLESNIDLASLHLRCGVLTGEPLTETAKTKIGEAFGIHVVSCYAPYQIPGPPVAVGCHDARGLRVFEDQCIVEVLDPGSGELMAPGQEGELVVTTLSSEAFPLIRYRTGDLSTVIEDSCGCGDNRRCIMPVRGRTDELVMVNDIRFYPTQIGAIVAGVEGVHPRFQLIIDQEEARDVVDVLVGVSGTMLSDEMRKFSDLKHRIETQVYEVLGLQVRVKLLESSTFEQQGQMSTLVDRRR